MLDQQGIIFEELGIKYIGPVDGYDIPKLLGAFRAANAVDGPTLVHVITKKGQGYSWSEKYPRKFHGVTVIYYRLIAFQSRFRSLKFSATSCSIWPDRMTE